MSDTAVQTPLTDLLDRVPTSAIVSYQPEPFVSHSIPVGRLCAEAAARIRELEQQLATSNASCESLRASAVSLSKDVAAHEKECAGRWVPCSERLPTERAEYWCRLEDEGGAFSTEVVWDGDRWMLHGASVTHWLDAKEPQP